MNQKMGMWIMIVGLQLAGWGAWAQQASHDRPTSATPPLITVSGRGEAAMPPDQAVVRLGVTAQHKQAAQAQKTVSTAAQRILDNLKQAGVAEKQIQTASLTLSPIYDQNRIQSSDRPPAPYIVGYQASNIVQVTLDDVGKVGEVIDAGMAGGANQVEGIYFQLKDDTSARQEALRLAVRQARAKAEAMAGALGVRLGPIADASEGGVEVFRPKMEMAGRAMLAAADVSTPVQPGQVRIEANVALSYRIIP